MKSILIVDDEKNIRLTLSECIQSMDYDIEMAENGEEALQKIKAKDFNLVLLDLRLPGMDGMEVLKRAKEAYPGVQVVMLTGHGSEKDEAEARRLGVFEYLRKPIPIESLMKVLKAAYEKKLQDAMVAATFAEAGEFGTAREIMDKSKKR